MTSRPSIPWTVRLLELVGCAFLFLVLAKHFWNFDLLPSTSLESFWIAPVIAGLLLMAPAFFHRVQSQVRMPRSEPLSTDRIKELGDPVAETTDWSPLHSGGSSFPIQRLVETSPMRLEFRATREALRFCLIFGATGVFFLALALVGAVQSIAYVAWMCSLLGLLLVGAGARMARSALQPRVFDRELGLYWKAKQPRGLNADDSENDQEKGRTLRRRQNSVALAQIHAVQVLQKTIDSHDGDIAGSGPYASFEINLVLHDGSRLNVCSHGGGCGPIYANAKRLGDFLNVPVWDA